MKERELQKECEAYLQSNGIKYIHIENNQHQQKYRRAANKKYKGFPDLTIFLPYGKTIFVELKTESGTVTLEQSETIDLLKNYGYSAEIITSLSDFKAHIQYQMSRLGHLLRS